mmetsp:Transcript_56388/g.150844  ORF Transcript_56388/g.150844 Transcript_56388/m.150844 type:complete len:87 (-) Transcript_56388:673-933(-)
MAAQSICAAASVVVWSLAQAAAATNGDSDESTSYDSESMMQDARLLLSVAAGISFMRVVEMVRPSQVPRSVGEVLSTSFKMYPFVL